MIFDLATFTWIHTAISIVAILSGAVVVADMIGGRARPAMTLTFLATAILTSATGFGFPFNGFLPSHGVGVVALIVLAAVILARWVFRLAGIWRPVYVFGMVASLYFLVFVLVAQGFAKVPALGRLAPTQSEPPFAIAEGAALLIFVIVGVLALRGFRRPAVA